MFFGSRIVISKLSGIRQQSACIRFGVIEGAACANIDGRKSSIHWGLVVEITDVQDFKVFKEDAALHVQTTIPIGCNPKLMRPAGIFVFNPCRIGWCTAFDYASIAANGWIKGVKGAGVVVGVVTRAETIVVAAYEVFTLIAGDEGPNISVAGVIDIGGDITI